MLQIIKYRKIFFGFSAVLFVASLILVAVWGLKFGIDFTGGTLLEISFNQDKPVINELTEVLATLNIEDLKIQTAGDDGFIMRSKPIEEAKHQEILQKLSEKYGEDKVVEKRFESVGPIVGEELKNKSILAIVVAIAAIIAFVAIAFRKVSRPVSSWKYGIGAVIALAHDLVIVIGFYALLGHFFGYEVDILFVTALLTILGYSVNDTIVVYDRTRENLFHGGGQTFEEIVNRSLNETMARSINTTLTTILALLALFIFGGATIQGFIVTLIIGFFFGAYSSIFVASPLLVVWQKMGKK